uniref:RRM domain-containing protein n=1 Tax=Percolomonas cosmopolitus TaxID=63605 RepID=A0A7S1KUY7_9EUKA|mmetsp:Transcript_9856/g.36756  ORF Transcript_9856/g.36756 Transcript_9856/m.36756 type:complete len:386 (+) Transcript_9856:1401-2558(+)
MSTQKRHQIQNLNEQELASHTTNTPSSWHSAYASSAYIRISNLNMALTEGDILTVFSQYGEITDLKLLRDSQSGLSRGMAFLCYMDQRSCILAIDNFNGIELAGKTITVDHALDYFRMLDKEELVPYLSQQLFGYKLMDTGQNFHLGEQYQKLSEREYEQILDIIDEHTVRSRTEESNEGGESILNGENAPKVVGNVIFSEAPQVKHELQDERAPAKIKKEKTNVKKERKRKRKSSDRDPSGKKKKKLSKEERADLLKEYQERCKKLRGVEAKEVDGHLYGMATGFDVRHGENRKTVDSREAYQKLHGYGGGEIKSTGRTDVDALDKYAYDMRKTRRDEDIAKLQEEEKEKLRERTRRHEEKMERQYKRRMQQREHGGDEFPSGR